MNKNNYNNKKKKKKNNNKQNKQNKLFLINISFILQMMIKIYL